MFQPIGLFSQVNCPDGERCRLINCIFLHSTRSTAALAAPVGSDSTNSAHGAFEKTGAAGPARKKQKVSAEVALPRAIVSDSEPVNRGMAATVTVSNARAQAPRPTSDNAGAAMPFKTTQRRISPPPLKPREVPVELEDTSAPTVSSARSASSAKPLSLNPRIVPKSPASHPIRSRLLRLMHEQFELLNEALKVSADESEKHLLMSPEELVKAALDEEERTAKSNVSIYSNVMKLRITALRKMTAKSWTQERIKILEKETRSSNSSGPKPVEISTGLNPPEEIALLQHLVNSQDGLAKHGYVVSQVSDDQIEKARLGVEAAHGYELCDRCKTRFQVFPGRREDGVLTTGGSCTYHFGRLRRPPVSGAPAERPERWTCCQASSGSEGCQVAPSHVFKVSDPKRLALVLPFKETTTPGPEVATSAVCFDCEMGYTTYGMELIRLTVTDWPSEKELLDVLVRPLGEILDLNSRFSGVWPEEFTKALPYDDQSMTDEDTKGKLRIVQSPSAARDMLLEHLTTTTPLIGHALENDLNAARILHPMIIDTVLLFPHPRGLPIRNGLKALMKRHLNKDIQMGGAQGHDSKEDARAAGELVRFKAAEIWKKMVEKGWTVMDGVLNAPKRA